MAVTVPSDAAEIENLRARLRAEEKKLDLVQEIGLALSSALDLDQLLALIMERITRLMDADRSTLFLFTEDGTELSSLVVQGGEAREIRLRPGEGIAGWVAQTGETVNIADAYADPRFQPSVDLRSGYRTRSILCMPMRNNLGATIGAVQVLNKVGGPFTADDAELLGALSGLAVVSIQNSKLYHSVVGKNVQLVAAQTELEARARELDLLIRVEQEMNVALDLDELLDRLLRHAMKLVGAEAGAILLRDPKSGDLTFSSVAGPASDAVRHERIPAGEGIAGWVAEQREPLRVNDPDADPRHLADLAKRIGHRPRNLLCVPLGPASETIGVIALIDKAGGGGEGFDEDELKLLVLVAAQASKAIQLGRAKDEREKEARLASIGQMLSGMLHDLRTPMTVISGYTQLMAGADDVAQREAYAEEVQRQFDHMSAMTREVLAFARGESIVLVRKVFLRRYLEAIACQLETELAGTGVELRLDLGTDDIAWFDEGKMTRVVHNLARNAVEAMPDGGVFRIGTRVTGDRLVLEFSDTGHGIPVAVEGRLFEAFATAGKAQGTGLGLAIVKKIVEEHDGTIACESVRGAGATFRISLPQSAASAR